jgi:hypothetical protein
MYYQLGNGIKTEVAQAASFLPSDHTWVGAKLGLFAVAGTVEAKESDSEGCAAARGYADFDYIHVKAISADE